MLPFCKDTVTVSATVIDLKKSKQVRAFLFLLQQNDCWCSQTFLQHCGDRAGYARLREEEVVLFWNSPQEIYHKRYQEKCLNFVKMILRWGMTIFWERLILCTCRSNVVSCDFDFCLVFLPVFLSFHASLSLLCYFQIKKEKERGCVSACKVKARVWKHWDRQDFTLSCWVRFC